MNSKYSRRQFVRLSSLAAGAVALAPRAMLGAQGAPKRTAVDEVTLGLTGVKLSRLGMGTGSMGGQVQTALGKEGFIRLVHYAYDQGIRYFDCAEAYSTFGWIADAIKGLPREKLFIQSKIDGKPADILGRIDRHRQNFGTDYVDSMLIHCMVKDGWTDEWKRIMDGFDQARDKQWIRAKGVSCHDLPALRAAVASDWTEGHLGRADSDLEPHHGRVRSGEGQAVDSGQGRFMPRPSRVARCGCFRLDGGPPGAGQSPGPPCGWHGSREVEQGLRAQRRDSRAGRVENHARQGPWRHRNEDHRQRRVSGAGRS